MKKNIIGIFVCLLLILTPISVVTISGNNRMHTTMLDTNLVNITGNWTEEQKLLASDGAEGNAFGWALSLSGDTALIGACYDDDSGTMCGSAYVFTLIGTTWTQQAKLLAADGAAFDYFGYSVSLSGDTALIGAHGDDGYKGSAYVFTRAGTSWTQQAKILASDGGADDWFGYSVSLSGDTALIGAHGDDGYKGSVYVFTRAGTSWTQQAKLLASDGAPGEWFGYSVSLSGDTALIGAHWDDTYQGSAYVFTRVGTTWSEQQKLIASDGEEWDYFGWSVSLSGDTALIGALFDDDNGADAGAAYVFTRSDTIWAQQAKLLAFDGAGNDQFGGSVVVDGDTALIGAWADDDNGADSGSSYVFIRSGTTWVQEAKLIASDGATDAQFGLSGALDENTALIGAPGDEYFKGGVYVFTTESENQPPLPDFSWSPQDPIINQQITFDASASQDPDGAIILYEWDWDNDGIYDEAHGSPSTTHSWSLPGSYPITVCVTDDDDAKCSLTKTVQVNGTVNFTIDITGGFGVTAVITNTGDINATNVEWTISLTGGFILFGKIKSGTALPMISGDSTTITLKPILGFGKTTIQVEVTCAEGTSANQTTNGTIFLFFVLGVK